MSEPLPITDPMRQPDLPDWLRDAFKRPRSPEFPFNPSLPKEKEKEPA